jgi:hypothetical protein
MIPITGLAFLMAAASIPGEPAVPAAPEVELALGYKVVGRTLEKAEDDDEFFAGDTIVAWTAVSGLASGFVEHVWYRDGVEVARHYLPVGAGRRWRTWTRHTVSAGEYTVQVLGPDGALLKETRFVVDGEGC